jgi:hypothetical protein
LRVSCQSIRFFPDLAPLTSRSRHSVQIIPAALQNRPYARVFTTKTEQMDVRPGGMWIHTMISADGVVYPDEVRFVEVEAPGRIVYDRISDPLSRATVTLASVAGGRTEVRFEMQFATRALRYGCSAQGAVQGLYDTLTASMKVQLPRSAGPDEASFPLDWGGGYFTESSLMEVNLVVTFALSGSSHLEIGVS